jgi:hypothetical protein
MQLSFGQAILSGQITIQLRYGKMIDNSQVSKYLCTQFLLVSSQEQLASLCDVSDGEQGSPDVIRFLSSTLLVVLEDARWWLILEWVSFVFEVLSSTFHAGSYRNLSRPARVTGITPSSGVTNCETSAFAETHQRHKQQQTWRFT